MLARQIGPLHRAATEAVYHFLEDAALSARRCQECGLSPPSNSLRLAMTRSTSLGGMNTLPVRVAPWRVRQAEGVYEPDPASLRKSRRPDL